MERSVFGWIVPELKLPSQMVYLSNTGINFKKRNYEITFLECPCHPNAV